MNRIPERFIKDRPATELEGQLRAELRTERRRSAHYRDAWTGLLCTASFAILVYFASKHGLLPRQ